MTVLIDALEHGPLHRFSDWPNPEVPNWRAGVYTVWHDDGRFLYVGMAGRGLPADAHLSEAAMASTRPKGLRDRLRSHASGRRSGDQFCIYVFDRLVLATLRALQIEQAAAGDLSLDSLTRSFIREHLSYRFVLTNASAEAHELEAVVRAEGLSGVRPFLNPLPGPAGGVISSR